MKTMPPKTRRGKFIIACHLYRGCAHGGHWYIRGDQTTVCPGMSRLEARED